MKTLLATALVLAAAPAGAQPAPCAVTFVRAPDDVRTVVEDWVRAEPVCATALELRIVPTEGGLYLLARDDSGRVRERVVPDAQAAGVLVASWVAADANAAPGAPVAADAPAVAVAPVAGVPVAAPPGPVEAPGVASPPGATESLAPGVAATLVAQPTPTMTPRWLSLGGMFAMSGTGGGGIRGELDLRARRYVTLGLAASMSESGMMLVGGQPVSIDTADAKVVGYVSLNARWGKWHLRSAFGAGVVYTRATMTDWRMGGSREAAGLFPTGEVSLGIGRELGATWAVHAGPVVSLYLQEYEIETSGPTYYGYTMEQRELEAMMLLAVRHRL